MQILRRMALAQDALLQMQQAATLRHTTLNGGGMTGSIQESSSLARPSFWSQSGSEGSALRVAARHARQWPNALMCVHQHPKDELRQLASIPAAPIAQTEGYKLVPVEQLELLRTYSGEASNAEGVENWKRAKKAWGQFDKILDALLAASPSTPEGK